MLGIDLDGSNHFRLMKVLFNAKHMFGNAPDVHIKLFRSSSGNGYHIEIHGIESNADIRAQLCDDPCRLFESERRAGFGIRKLDDYLFDRKRVYNGEWKKRVEIYEWQIV